MTAQPPEPARPAPAWKPLDARQRRVLGVLIEKAKTTPAAYPMSVNAIVAGCNQKSNRDPLSAYDDIDVEKALDELRTLGVVSELDWLGRVSKYKHHAYEWLGVSKAEIAVMTELLLRGAQALGELRARAARMEPIADLAALKPIVDGLVERGLMLELTPPGRGQIVSHNLYSAPELAELRAQHSGQATRSAHLGDDEPARAPAAAAEAGASTGPRSLAAVSGSPPAHGVAIDRAGELSAEIAELRAEVAWLRDKVAELESRLAAALG
ncbi:MAG TPA: DUF480 domain-containing protein [Candidatus Eisenbacteria bacterium]|jgi:uncharacterized protein YceH (UPF0502 family)